jgi:uncharacterized protein YxeA
MKKISAVLLGLSLTLATAGMSFAAQAAATPTDNSTPTVKKHVKKHKKANKGVVTPATAATAAPATAK